MLKLKDITEEITLWDPTERESFYGPLINENAYKNYKIYIEIGKEGGKIWNMD